MMSINYIGTLEDGEDGEDGKQFETAMGKNRCSF
jgi:hypothetical protein